MTDDRSPRRRPTRRRTTMQARCDVGRSWRDVAAPLVADVLAEGMARGLEDRALVLWANAQFPWGPREVHPYEVWKSEVKRQLGLVKLGRRGRPADLPGQGMLF